MTVDGKCERWSLALLLTLTTTGLLLLLQTVGLGNYALDDGYIVEHAVAGLNAGAETRFIGSTPWQGVTSPAHVATIWLVSQWLPLQLAHWAVNAAATLFLTAGLFRLCRQSGLGNVISATVALATLTTGLVLYQLHNGLETGLAMAALTWMLVALQRERPPMWCYVLIAAMPFIRPELAAFSLGSGAFLFFKRPVGALLGLSVTLAAGLLFALLLVMETGALVPNTVSAKTYFFGESCLPIGTKTGMAAWAIGIFVTGLGLAALGFAYLAESRLRGLAAFFHSGLRGGLYLALPGRTGA